MPAYPTRGRSQPQFEILEVSRKDFGGIFGGWIFAAKLTGRQATFTLLKSGRDQQRVAAY